MLRNAQTCHAQVVVQGDVVELGVAVVEGQVAGVATDLSQLVIHVGAGQPKQYNAASDYRKRASLQQNMGT